MLDLSGKSRVTGRVTIITATYNAAHLLARCIESVATQSYPDIEHIIIDGGSTDGTVNVIQRYPANIAYWISESDRGIYDAWNKGIVASTGEWIGFLGADDVYLPGALSAYMRMASDSGAEYVSSRVRWVPKPPERPKLIGHSWRWPEFSREMTTAHVGSMHHFSLFERLGLFDLFYRITADYDLLLRARASLRTAFLAEVTAQMDAGGNSDSFGALREAERCKVRSGGRNRLLARLELWIKRGKLSTRRARVLFYQIVNSRETMRRRRLPESAL